MTVKILCDTSADLNLPIDQTIYDKYNIGTFPMHVIFGTNDYRELIDIKTSEFKKKIYETDVHPTTSQPTQFDILTQFEKYGKEYDEIISFHISSKLSGSYTNAQIAKKMYEKSNKEHAKVYLVDSLLASSAFGLVVIKAAKLAEEGLSGQEIVDKINEWKKNNIFVYFTVENLEWLYRGGRLSKSKYYLGSMLNKKPVLTFVDGEIVSAKTVTGIEKTFDTIIDLAFKHFPKIEHERIMYNIIEFDYKDVVDDVIQRTKNKYPHAKEGKVFEMGGTIAAHTGPRTLGFIVTKDFEF